MKPKNLFSRNPFRPLWLMLALFGSGLAVQAAVTNSYSFQGSGSGTPGKTWTNYINWAGSVTPNFTNAPGQDLVFGIPGVLQTAQIATDGNIKNGTEFYPTSYVHSVNFTCNNYTIGPKDALSVVILGDGGIINNTNSNPGETSAGGGTFVSTPTSWYTYTKLGSSCTLYNGDLTQPFATHQDALNFQAGNGFGWDLQEFTLTIDGPGTNTFSSPSSTHAGGAIKGTGGIILQGTGQTTFNATNTYTGPTVIKSGRLIVSTWCKGGGSYSVYDGAGFAPKVGQGNTLNISTLNITNSNLANLTFTNGLTFFLTSANATGNPTVPVVTCNTLNLSGTNFINIVGTGLSPGTIDLIQYTTENNSSGTGIIVTSAIPSGCTGYLVDNTGTKKWQLVLLTVPSLIWSGNTNGTVNNQWDQNVTSNWLNTASSPPNQPAYFANGLPVTLDDTASTRNVVLDKTNVQPYSITVNTANTYTISNNAAHPPAQGGWQIAGGANVIKTGTGTLILATSNVYSGYTAISQGKVILAAQQAIGSASVVTNNGTLDLDGYSLTNATLIGNSSGLVTNSTTTPINYYLQFNSSAIAQFDGRIDEGNGPISLYKMTGPLYLTGNNRYSGGTVFAANGAAEYRWLLVGNDHALGSGPVHIQVNGTLTADYVSPRTVTNAIYDASSFSFGQTNALGVKAQRLTLTGLIDFSNGVPGDVSLTFPSDVVFSGPVQSEPPAGWPEGWGTKAGPGTLTLASNTVTLVNNSADMRIYDGTMILDGASMTVSLSTNTAAFRVMEQNTNGFARMAITNGGSLTLPWVADLTGTNTALGPLRLGDTSSPPGSTNVADISGTFTVGSVVMGYSNTNNAGGGAYARLSLLPNSQASFTSIGSPGSNCTAITEVFLNGATINVPTNAASTFISGMTNVFIQSGGVTLNGANTNNSIHIRQNLLEGSPGGGGLTWNGTNAANPANATQLQLDGINTYTGTTYINSGTLGGTGTLSGPLILQSAGALSPAGSGSTSGGNLGTFTVNNNVTFNASSSATFEINNTNTLVTGSPITNDMLVVSGTISAGGATLNVANRGATNVVGDYFKLFNQGVSFGTVNLPGLTSGLAWENDLVTLGSIQVVAQVTGPVGFPNNAIAQLPDGNFALTVTGAVSTSWSLHATNDLSEPIPWPVIQSGNIGVGGLSVINDLKATNSANRAHRFYQLSSP